MTSIVEDTWKIIRNPTRGMYVTKHFIERFYERSNDLTLLRNIIRSVRSRLCVLIYETALMPDQTDKIVKVDGYVIVLSLSMNPNSGHPELKLVTFFKD